ncbi:helix-turn-helix domain-containing protein [Halovulum sp. GXIMD14794]
MPQKSPQNEPQEGFIRLIQVSPFIEYLAASRIDMSGPVESMGLELPSLKDPNVYVHAEILYGLLNAFADAANDPYLGVHVGEYHNLAGWPVFANAAKTSKTLAEFFTNFIRQVPKEASSVRHELTIGDETAVYRVYRLHPPAVSPAHAMGFGVSHYSRLFHAVAGPDWNPAEVTVRSAYVEAIPPNYAGHTIARGSEHDLSFRFPASWLFRDLRFVSRATPARFDEPSQEVSVIAALRSVLSTREDLGTVGPADVAAALGIAEDRLAKALKRHETTIPRELKRYKIDRAKELLHGGKHTVAEIGRILGYADNSHFTRFFRSQTGTTPSDYLGSRDTARR